MTRFTSNSARSRTVASWAGVVGEALFGWVTRPPQRTKSTRRPPKPRTPDQEVAIGQAENRLGVSERSEMPYSSVFVPRHRTRWSDLSERTYRPTGQQEYLGGYDSPRRRAASPVAARRLSSEAWTS